MELVEQGLCLEKIMCLDVYFTFNQAGDLWG